MSGFSINQVCISGGLTRDPELRTTQSGTEVCNFRIAAVTNRRKDPQTGEWSDQKGYFDVTVWGGMGAWLARNLNKGAQVVVNGTLNWREWQTKDGDKRQSIDIVVNAGSGAVIPVPKAGDSGSTSSDSQAEFSGPHGDNEIPF